MRRALPIVLTLSCLLVPAHGMAAGKSVTEAKPAEKNAAAQKYAVAMAAFDKDDLEKALKGFQESYNVVKSPNSHFMIARTLARLGRNAEAYDELNAVITEADELGPKYEDTLHAAFSKLDEIKPRVGLLVVTLENAPKGTTVAVGDEPLDPARLGKPVPVLPGETAVTATPPGKPKRTEKVTVQGGNTASLKMDLASPEPGKPPPEPIYHDPYRVELEVEIVGETLAPPHGATRGAGAGVRGSFPVTQTGVLGNMDNLALATGVDWIGTSTDPHFYVPAQLQWNIFLTDRLSLRFEPGAALLFGAGTRVTPSLYAGARFRVWKNLYVHGRVGVPVATIGASLFL